MISRYYVVASPRRSWTAAAAQLPFNSVDLKDTVQRGVQTMTADDLAFLIVGILFLSLVSALAAPVDTKQSAKSQKKSS